MMSNVDFVFVDQIAVGVLVTEGECKRFCGASTALAPLEGAVFADLEEAETAVALHLRHGGERGRAK